MKTSSRTLHDQLLSFEVFRVDELPPSLRSRPYLPQELSALARRGALLRVRRGGYVVVPPGQAASFTPDPFRVASLFARPYAISFYSALEVHGLAESVSHRIHIQSPTFFKSAEFQNVEFKWVQGSVDFGVETERRGSVDLQVTDVERTLLDCLRQPHHAGGLDELLRALEGVHGGDLLSQLLERMIAASGAPADRAKFRADFEDRRPELADLVQAGLIIDMDGRLFLSATGLLVSPHPSASIILRVASRLFSELRVRYRANPEALHKISELAHVLQAPEVETRIAAIILNGTQVAHTIPQPMGLPSSIRVQEPILDSRDFDHFSAKLLARASLPQGYSSAGRRIAYLRTERLLDYLRRFGESALYAKTGLLLSLFAKHWTIGDEVLSTIRRHLPKAPLYFPPKLPKGSGRLIRDWNVIVPSFLHSRYRMATDQSQETA